MSVENKSMKELKKLLRENRKFKNQLYWKVWKELNNRYNAGDFELQGGRYMRVNKDTTWGDLEPDLSFLDHPAFPDSTKRPENQGGDIDAPSYTDVIYEKYMQAVGETKVLEDREIKRDVEQYRRNLKQSLVSWSAKALGTLSTVFTD